MKSSLRGGPQNISLVEPSAPEVIEICKPVISSTEPLVHQANTASVAVPESDDETQRVSTASEVGMVTGQCLSDLDVSNAVAVVVDGTDKAKKDRKSKRSSHKKKKRSKDSEHIEGDHLLSRQSSDSSSKISRVETKDDHRRREKDVKKTKAGSDDRPSVKSDRDSNDKAGRSDSYNRESSASVNNGEHSAKDAKDGRPRSSSHVVVVDSRSRERAGGRSHR